MSKMSFQDLKDNCPLPYEEEEDSIRIEVKVSQPSDGLFIICYSNRDLAIESENGDQSYFNKISYSRMFDLINAFKNLRAKVTE